jgi:hypothetical protein
MKPMKFGIGMFAVVGALIMLLLQLHFALSWDNYYSHFPFQGYSSPAGPPFFSTSALSLKVTETVLFALPLFVLWFARQGAIASTWGLLSGVVAAFVAIWVFTKPLREDSNMWPIDLVLLTVMTGAPLFLGCAVHVAVRRVFIHIRNWIK